MSKSRETMAKETLEKRIRMWNLVKEGAQEEEALKEILPDDRHRKRTLDGWKEKDLYPPPEAKDQNYRYEIADQNLPNVPPSELPTAPNVQKTTESPEDLENLRSELKDFVRKEIAQAMVDLQTVPNIPQMETRGFEIPPDTPRKEKSREFEGQREKIAGTTDKVLFDLFERERKQRGMSISKMIDTILWTYFEKPKLSFEVEKY